MQPRNWATFAKKRIEEVRTVQRILSHAVQVFSARGDADKVSPEHRALARSWLNRLDDIVDAHFFENLQEEFEADENDRQGIRNHWLMNGEQGRRGRPRPRHAPRRSGLAAMPGHPPLQGPRQCRGAVRGANTGQ